MAIAANSYGSVAGVAGLVPRYTTSSTFDTTTRPTLAQVESGIDSISGILNSMLAQAGFSVPVTVEDVTDALDLFVNEEVAAIAEGINGAGRFGPTTKQAGGKGRFALIMDDAKAFIDGNADGFEALGATRTSGALSMRAFSVSMQRTDGYHTYNAASESEYTIRHLFEW